MITYTITEGAHQSLIDLLRAVKKGSLTKGRMSELAAVHLDDLTIKRQEAEAPDPFDNLPAGDLVILFHEHDGTERIIVWHQADEEGGAGYRPDTSGTDSFAVQVRRNDELAQALIEERAHRTQDTSRVDGVLSELQDIAGVKAPIHVLLNRLRDAQECLDALMVLPSKAGTMRALRRVLALRSGLQDSIEYIRAVTAYLELLNVNLNALTVQQPLDASDYDAEMGQIEEQGLTLLSTIEKLAKPPAPH